MSVMQKDDRGHAAGDQRQEGGGLSGKRRVRAIHRAGGGRWLVRASVGMGGEEPGGWGK